MFLLAVIGDIIVGRECRSRGCPAQRNRQYTIGLGGGNRLQNRQRMTREASKTMNDLAIFCRRHYTLEGQIGAKESSQLYRRCTSSSSSLRKLHVLLHPDFPFLLVSVWASFHGLASPLLFLVSSLSARYANVN